MNPIAYLLVSLEFTSLMLAIIFLIAWRNFGRHSYALIWSLTFMVAAVQWALNLGQQVLFASHDVYWMTVSATSIATVSLALAGHRQRTGRRNPVAIYVVAGLLAEAAIGVFTFLVPHVGLRASIGPFYTALLLAFCVPAVTRRSLRPLPAERGTAIVLGIFAVCEALAASAILSGGAAGDASAMNAYLAINFLSLPAAYIGSGLFTVLILASDMSEATKRLAITDVLTGLLNRRGFLEAAARSFADARRSGSPLALVAADLDHFKAINDLHGHAAGDAALVAFARALGVGSRASDVAGRIGGEEFVLLLPNTSEGEAVEIADRLRRATHALSIAGEGVPIRVRASFGIAVLGAADGALESLLRRADAALYQSKQLGRDRVTAAVASDGERDAETEPLPLARMR